MPVPLSLLDVTGAGDAFSAGLLFGYLHERCVKNAMPYAMAAACLTIQTTSSVAEGLDAEGLHKHASYYRNFFIHDSYSPRN